jgi:hypothetical protein
MDTVGILNELKRQRDALDAAIAALGGRKQNGRRRTDGNRPKVSRPKRRLSAAARKRISDAAKARWAKAKKAGRNVL